MLEEYSKSATPYDFTIESVIITAKRWEFASEGIDIKNVCAEINLFEHLDKPKEDIDFLFNLKAKVIFIQSKLYKNQNEDWNKREKQKKEEKCQKISTFISIYK